MSSIAQGHGPVHGELRPMTKEERKVILASSIGTIFEWYDFYLFGALAALIGKHFFAPLTPTAQFIMTLLGFAAGFAVRPFGAIVFGRVGDLVGRKYTFLVTMLIMGTATLGVGLLPGYASWGIWAPIILITLRLAQGLALGGEYGGAATYVAEHAPHGKRGFYTSFIQTTATLGLFLSLLVILVTRLAMGEDDFAEWGWRIPFWLSALLLVISVWIRLRLNESPPFLRMKEAGRRSKAPLKESFGQWRNLKIVILAFVGLTAGQAVVWYTGQFYALFFLTQTLKVDLAAANYMMAAALLLGTPFFIAFGALSDKIGRKKVMMAGCALAILTYFPIFKALTDFANPALAAAQFRAPVTVLADPQDCSFQFNPTGTARFNNSCDIAKSILTTSSVNYARQSAAAGTVAAIKVGDKVIQSYDPKKLSAGDVEARDAEFRKNVTEAIRAAGYPSKADPNNINYVVVVLLLTILVLYVTMLYGPVAAILVELFPTRIRYTSMSLPYHIGNGWLGGFLPATAFAIVAATGDIYSGLWYPIVVASITLVIGTLFLPETRNRDIYAND